MNRLLRNLARLSVRIAVIVAGIAAVAWLGYRLWRGPDPETILAGLDIPPAPALSPREEHATFRIAPGFRVELVAAEPMVVDPVAMDWDDEGRLYVVEMRGFMGDIDGGGEERPIGQVVVLEDVDHDGRMDERHVFLDGLVLPRAIAVLPEGVLLGVPPDLILCRDANVDRRCKPGEQERLDSYADESGNVEHRENGLLAGIDGWIYNAKSSRRFRLHRDSFESEKTVFRGQWGIAQDDDGRLYFNHNSGFLYVDLFPGESLLRQPATAAKLNKLGLNVDLAANEQVWGVRVAAGLNRAYQPGTLRADGRQNGPTGISGVAIQRGDQFGEEYKGDAFVPESAGSTVSRFVVEHDGLTARATHVLYPDPDWTQREFLASTDERFRPVDVKIGPDGALYVIDMYRGVIQHAHYVSDYLREYVERHDLEAPGATGRIWRIVREDEPIAYGPPPLATPGDQLRALDHPNGWVRDHAQRRIVFEDAPGVATSLANLGAFSPLARTHALWALHGLGRLESPTWAAAMRDSDARVRRTALRVGESLLPESGDALVSTVLEALRDSDASVQLQAIHSLGTLPSSIRPVAPLLAFSRNASPIERQAILSSLSGLEAAVLRSRLAEATTPPEWLRALATAAITAAREGANATEEVTALLDLVRDHAGDGRDELLLEGFADAQRLPGHRRIVLGGPHPIFASTKNAALRPALQRIRPGFTWQGDPNPGGARALTREEERRRAEGEKLFAATCATCHGAEGRGLAGLAPPLAGSPWARDADEWLVRIVLHGLRGPILVDGARWNSAMPGHGHDPRFSDIALAGLATHIRRAWGHADAPISPQDVARIRAAAGERDGPWTVQELLALPIAHRLDRFTGTYRIPVVGLEMVVRRDGPQLTIGRQQGGEAPLLEIADGFFSGEGMQLLFDPTVTGKPLEAQLSFGEQSVTVSRSED